MRIIGWLVLLSLIGTEGAIAQTQVIRRARDVVDQAETATTERLESVSTDEVESRSGSNSSAAAPAQAPNLPNVIVPATPGIQTPGSQRAIEFTAPSAPVVDAGQPSPEALARWHIRNNLCERSEWSLQDFQSLFPMIDPGLVRQVCGS